MSLREDLVRHLESEIEAGKWLLESYEKNPPSAGTEIANVYFTTRAYERILETVQSGKFTIRATELQPSSDIDITISDLTL